MTRQPRHPIAFCECCKILFPATAVVLQDSGIVLQNVQINCPRCHGMGAVLDGYYEEVGGALKAFISPDISPAAREAVLALIRQVRANQTTLAEAKKKAERIDKRLGRLFDIENWSDEARATLFAGVLAAGATLTLAAATVAVPFIAPTPIVQVVTGSPPMAGREKLLSGTALVRPAPPVKREQRDHVKSHPRAHPSSKQHAGKKRPYPPR